MPQLSGLTYDLAGWRAGTYSSDLDHDGVDAGLPHVPQQPRLRLAPQVRQAQQPQPPAHLPQRHRACQGAAESTRLLIFFAGMET